MNAFLKYLWIQLKMDLRDKGTLMTYYLTPLLFFFVMGAVFSSINPLMKTSLAATMTIFAVTMGAVMGIPAPIVKMRESGTLRAFRVNGIPGPAVLSVHAISAFLHLFIVSVIIYIAAPLAYHSTVPKAPMLYFAVLAVFLAASIAIGMLIGVFARSQSFATMLSMIIFLPSLLLSGIMFPASMLPKSFIWLGRIFPATHALQAFYGFAYQIQTDFSAGLALGIVAATALLLFALAILRFGSIRRSEQ
ncbi:MAG: ABC transporter permease [Clostridia bacterium]|nr:ABC transporter permease [Clostridia bacterium]